MRYVFALVLALSALSGLSAQAAPSGQPAAIRGATASKSGVTDVYWRHGWRRPYGFGYYRPYGYYDDYDYYRPWGFYGHRWGGYGWRHGYRHW